MTRKICGMLLVSGLMMPAAQGKADDVAVGIKVAATIAPVHSLASMVTDGIAEPALIIRPGASPHSYAMKPSEARSLDDADVVFWVGEALEPWMAKAVGTLAGDAVVVELAAVEGVRRLDSREGGAWAAHQDAGHDEPAEPSGGHGLDPHFWLDPDNAEVWLDAMARALAAADPDNAANYEANAAHAAKQLAAMTADIEISLAPLRGTPYVVFHDAYQYFERRFDLHPVGSISLGDADRPSAARIVDIREQIKATNAVCIFAEPQFEPKLIETVIEGTTVRTSLLDPIGADLAPGSELYPTLIQDLAAALASCLG